MPCSGTTSEDFLLNWVENSHVPEKLQLLRSIDKLIPVRVKATTLEFHSGAQLSKCLHELCDYPCIANSCMLAFWFEIVQHTLLPLQLRAPSLRQLHSLISFLPRQQKCDQLLFDLLKDCIGDDQPAPSKREARDLNYRFPTLLFGKSEDASSVKIDKSWIPDARADCKRQAPPLTFLSTHGNIPQPQSSKYSTLRTPHSSRSLDLRVPVLETTIYRFDLWFNRTRDTQKASASVKRLEKS